MPKLNLSLALCALSLLTAAPLSGQADVWQPKPYVSLTHPDWSRDAILYQINTRQFTREGTFRAAERELPRLKALGVDIIWLMPIHPIGKENRKGSLGSPYSVQDYYAVNPEFGTKEDLRHFVSSAHAQGFKVILDLVANHTAWDNQLRIDHPDWYEKDWKGDFRPTPWWDWSDIIDLDWSQPGVREHVGGAMEYWVREFGIDGYRADVAGYVPIDFWESERARLDAIRPVFMLAEWKTSELTRRAFDAVYAWEWHVTAKQIAKGDADATAFYGYYAENESAWPREAMRLTYIENHDSNAWEGTQYENSRLLPCPPPSRCPPPAKALATIYNGQEACNSRRLEFFEKDPIMWDAVKDCSLGTLFRDLIAFRRYPRLAKWLEWGARMEKVDNDKPKQLFAWLRRDDKNKVLGLFNLSNAPVSAKLADAHSAGTYRDFATGKTVEVTSGDTVILPAWGYRLLSSDGG
ncbi:MAG: alpha-amylase family glycosyl hydrolase [Parasphingorhabdus sp.]|nr:alpha-amylase family glycosyl hydrolase [Parasphingorhabdus sp.]